MIVASVILADRKSYSEVVCLKALVETSEIERIYLNVQSSNQALHAQTLHYLASCGKPYDYDFWDIFQSSWLTRPQYDQHQVRLIPIVIARNMAIDYALSANATHLLFVDSDVVIHPGGVKKLVELDAPLCGGKVPGRGAHKDLFYIFGSKGGIRQCEDGLIECDHGTYGYMLIRREVFGRLRFRWGDDSEVPGQLLSEDPAFCEDWRRMSGQRFIIHPGATADHLDNPTRPLRAEEVAQDTWQAVQTTSQSYPVQKEQRSMTDQMRDGE